MRASALAAWDAVNLGTGQVHVVSLKPVLVRFFDEELHDPTPNRCCRRCDTSVSPFLCCG